MDSVGWNVGVVFVGAINHGFPCGFDMDFIWVSCDSMWFNVVLIWFNMGSIWFNVETGR